MVPMSSLQSIQDHVGSQDHVKCHVATDTPSGPVLRQREQERGKGQKTMDATTPDRGQRCGGVSHQ